MISKLSGKKYFKKKKVNTVFILIGTIVILTFFLKSAAYQTSFGFLGSKLGSFFYKIKVGISNGATKEDCQNINEKNLILLKENALLRESLNIGNKKINEDSASKFSLEEIEITGKENFFEEPLLFALGGEDKGIQNGFPVVEENGVMVGKIESAQNNLSKIILIPNHNSKIGARIAGTDLTGVVSGSHDLRAIMEMIPLEGEIKLGDPVVTDNSDPNIPAGILLGKVASVKESSDHLFKEALLEISWDTRRMLKLWVVTGRK